MKRSIRHEFVKIFGGTYYSDKNHEIADWYSYAGIIPSWIRCVTFDIKRWFILQWYKIQILYYKIRESLSKLHKKKSIVSHKIYVAVLSAYEDKYRLWVRENKKPNEEYFRVNSIGSVDGRNFSRIEYVHGWQRMKDAYDIQHFTEILLEINNKYNK